jgi:hypothetical protein
MHRPTAVSWLSAALGIFGTALLTMHCSGGDAPARAAERSDSAGVEIVTSSGVAVPLSWTFTARMRIGGDNEGPAAFYNVGAGTIAVDGDGRIVVLDRDNMRAAAFDSAGAPLWMAGKEGGGPGEFRFPFSVAVRGDTVEVQDGGGERELFHIADGRHLATERLARFASRRAPIEGGGDVLEYIGTPLDAEEGREHRLVLSRDTDTLVIAALPYEEQSTIQFEDCPVMLAMPPVFGRDIVWTVFDGQVLVNTEPAWVIDVYRDTILVRRLRRSVTPIPATAELAALEYPDDFRVRVPSGGLTCEKSAEDVVAEVGFRDLIPSVRGILVQPDGTVWVRRNSPRAELGTFDLISPDGGYRGTLIDAPVPLAFMPDGDVVGVERDELDVARVVVYDIGR